MNKIKLLAIIGEAGSGKDSLLKEIVKRKPKIHEIISNTTRPIREGEKEGVNYYYKTTNEFLEDLKIPNKMLEYSIFNNWYYGTSMEAIDKNKVNIGVFNPQGIRNLLSNAEAFNLKIIRIKTPDKQRLMRQLQREFSPNIDEIIRRYQTDKNDFKDLEFSYRIVINQDGDMEHAVESLLDEIEQLENH